MAQTRHLKTDTKSDDIGTLTEISDRNFKAFSTAGMFTSITIFFHIVYNPFAETFIA